MVKVYLDDVQWGTSPSAGDKDCLCSRCLNVIGEQEVPVRFMSLDEEIEYRFCEKCIKKEIYEEN